MKNNVSNINFTSNIKFVPRNKLMKEVFRHEKPTLVSEMYDPKDVEEITKIGATKNILFCVAGVLRDFTQKKDSIFHFYPSKVFGNFYTERPKDSIKNIKTALQNIPSSQSVGGLVIGGLSSFTDPKNSTLSRKMISLLNRGLKHVKNQDFTVFFSQRGTEKFDYPFSSFAYSKEADTYYVSCENAYGDLLNPEQIRDNFDYIKISPNDKIFVEDTQIPNNFFEKSKTVKTS